MYFESEIPADEAYQLSGVTFQQLETKASKVRDKGFRDIVTYSRKVFIPLTRLCRDSCHYCTFAKAPGAVEAAYLLPEEVLSIALAGKEQGCSEALFTLGDKPELRYRAAKDWLRQHGHETTVSYLEAACRLVFQQVGLLPHVNAGLMSADEFRRIRAVSVSQGIMLETASDRLSKRGRPHFGSPDKDPKRRLASLEMAGREGVPMTTGILVGIGETRQERIDALLKLRDLHRRYGHIQEIIIQNFRAKAGTRMAHMKDLPTEDHLWTVAAARLIFGSEMSIQAPPNLQPGGLNELVRAGINDWGGISPVTPDHVNPEARWPAISDLRTQTEQVGKILVERLPIYPRFASNPERWIDPAMRAVVLQRSDASGLARSAGWIAGSNSPLPKDSAPKKSARVANDISDLAEKASAGCDLGEAEIVRLFSARGSEFDYVCDVADRLRSKAVGADVTYVVTRNINYTNVCHFGCKFCAFSKGKSHESLRGAPYVLDEFEIQRRALEAWERGATEVCLQGGIHPGYSGRTYLGICRSIKAAVPDIHVHAFSPLEVWQGARSLGLSLEAYLGEMKEAGLGSIPGTAAEILDDEVRAVLCPDKITTAQWLEVIETAHRLGIRTTATIMFGHVDSPLNWARHLLHIRRLQQKTGGFTEFVPLPFVPMETPIFIKGRARPGPTLREAVLMHAVSRLVLYPLINNIQASWVKLGREGLRLCLAAGVNDLGGTLMEESITRAAGAVHGQEMRPQQFVQIIEEAGRVPRLRTTLYEDAPAERKQAAFNAGPLQVFNAARDGRARQVASQ